jgi:hypothetical protein
MVRGLNKSASIKKGEKQDLAVKDKRKKVKKE